MTVTVGLEDQVTDLMRQELQAGKTVSQTVTAVLATLSEDEKDQLLFPVLEQKGGRLLDDINIVKIHPGFIPSPRTTNVPVTPVDGSNTIQRTRVRSKEREALRQYAEARLPKERATAFIQVASQKFTTGGVEYPWNKAPRSAHQSKAKELESQAKGHIESAKLHHWGDDEIAKCPGAQHIQDVLDYFFSPVGNSAGHKAA